ncbi:hypothetical protein [Paenibacillus sp. NPDC058071]|uniref:hypothetical protein n=1 Tax=Paenibacillus sp. NPDC058071 TaxID=3346326 RepID=UPI0036DA3E3E
MRAPLPERVLAPKTPWIRTQHGGGDRAPYANIYRMEQKAVKRPFFVYLELGQGVHCLMSRSQLINRISVLFSGRSL